MTPTPTDPPGERITDPEQIRVGDLVRIGDTWHEVSDSTRHSLWFDHHSVPCRLPGLYAIRPAPKVTEHTIFHAREVTFDGDCGGDVNISLPGGFASLGPDEVIALRDALSERIGVPAPPEPRVVGYPDGREPVYGDWAFDAEGFFYWRDRLGWVKRVGGGAFDTDPAPESWPLTYLGNRNRLSADALARLIEQPKAKPVKHDITLGERPDGPIWWRCTCGAMDSGFYSPGWAKEEGEKHLRRVHGQEES